MLTGDKGGKRGKQGGDKRGWDFMAVPFLTEREPPSKQPCKQGG